MFYNLVGALFPFLFSLVASDYVEKVDARVIKIEATECSKVD